MLHLLAAAHEAEIDFTMADIDRLSRRVPVLCKVAPAVADVHMEDVHRAGGIMAILGELDRAGLIDTSLPTVHSATMADALARWDITQTQSEAVRSFYSAAPGGVPTQTAFSQDRRFAELDADREKGVIRSAEHAYSKDGGLAVRFGNIAARRLHREDGGRRCLDPQVLRPGRDLREPGRCGRGHPQPQGQGRRYRADPL